MSGGGPPGKSSSLPPSISKFFIEPEDPQHETTLPPILGQRPPTSSEASRQQSEPPSRRESSSSRPSPLDAYPSPDRIHRVHSNEPLRSVRDPYRRSDDSHIHPNRLANESFHRSRHPDERGSSIPHGFTASSSSSGNSRSTTPTSSWVGSHTSLSSRRDTVTALQRSRTWQEGEAGPSNVERRKFLELTSPDRNETEAQPTPQVGEAGPSIPNRRIAPLPRSNIQGSARSYPRASSPSDADLPQSRMVVPSQASLGTKLQQKTPVPPSYPGSLAEAGDAEPPPPYASRPPFHFTTQHDDDKSSSHQPAKRRALVHEGATREFSADKKSLSKKAAVACEFCKGRKLRCSGILPCTNCDQRGRDCVFKPPKRRGPGKANKNAYKGKLDRDKLGEFHPLGQEKSQQNPIPETPQDQSQAESHMTVPSNYGARFSPVLPDAVTQYRLAFPRPPELTMNLPPEQARQPIPSPSPTPTPTTTSASGSTATSPNETRRTIPQKRKSADESDSEESQPRKLAQPKAEAEEENQTPRQEDSEAKMEDPEDASPLD